VFSTAELPISDLSAGSVICVWYKTEEEKPVLRVGMQLIMEPQELLGKTQWQIQHLQS